jgi:hypothetical protein
MRKFSRKSNEQGSIIVTILLITMFLAVVASAISMLANANLIRAKSRIMVLQAQYSAESGADAAIAMLNSDPSSSYSGTGTSQTQVLTTGTYKATYSTTVTSGSSSNERIITSIGRVYQPVTATNPSYTRKIEVVAQRTSSSVAVAGMLSRNILEIDSSVKDIVARDFYANGYINMNKNTTTLIAENITIAGKNTSASNCSIGGTGNLQKPTSFSTAGQTKTRLNLAFNNCISPPGNASNADFEVLVNQNNIPKVQSTYIPWSQYMDNTYQNSAGGCNDWSSGSSPRTIPSTGNTKKTHYPDSSSNISTSCGSSGDLSLGSSQYNITDNVHVRANFCATTACTPVFYNPTATVKYIFVEGSINFEGVTTASGSGPIVLISYGTDPASKSSVCPYGGSFYTGNGTVNAPNLYFLATNGLCLDKTKFGSSTSLGGISGKNIYISSNSGSPFDPQISNTFPTSAVPVDLAWHAARYRRL